VSLLPLIPVVYQPIVSLLFPSLRSLLSEYAQRWVVPVLLKDGRLAAGVSAAPDGLSAHCVSTFAQLRSLLSEYAQRWVVPVLLKDGRLAAGVSAAPDGIPAHCVSTLS